MMLRLSALLVSLAGVFSCSLFAHKEKPGDQLLARVYGRELYLSEMEGMFPPATSSSDSALIISAYIQRWAREALLLNEAENNLPRGLKVDELVQDYRESLIKNNYEQVLVEQLLDTLISDEELQAFYEQNKEQYQLDRPIIRCQFIKIAANAPDIRNLINWWTDTPTPEKNRQINTYCDQYAESHILDNASWHKLDEVAAALPPGSLTEESLDSRKEFRQSDSQYQYFFRLLEVKNSREIAPLAYIEGQARKYILHLRKLKLLEEKRNDLYEVGVRRKAVKIFTEE
ncbi:MAG: hypothetical protein ACKOAY_06145 [Haliscomenobacter sp.]